MDDPTIRQRRRLEATMTTCIREAESALLRWSAAYWRWCGCELDDSDPLLDSVRTAGEGVRGLLNGPHLLDGNPDRTRIDSNLESLGQAQSSKKVLADIIKALPNTTATRRDEALRAVEDEVLPPKLVKALLALEPYLNPSFTGLRPVVTGRKGHEAAVVFEEWETMLAIALKRWDRELNFDRWIDIANGCRRRFEALCS